MNQGAEEVEKMAFVLSALALAAMVASHLANPVVVCPEEPEYDYR